MYILFNIGGTNLRIGVSKDGQTIAKSVVKPTPSDYKEGLALIESLAVELSEGEKIEGIAGGIAGRLNDDKSGLYASNLPDWRDQPLRDDLKTKFGCTVILENDTAVEAIGESRFGSGQGLDILAYLSIGTGVGGARVIANQLDHNAYGFEPGHQIIVKDGLICSCGKPGHAEAYLSGKLVEARLGKSTHEISDESFWREYEEYLACTLYNTLLHWSPNIIVLGGGIANNQNISFERINDLVFEHSKVIFEHPIAIKKGSLGDEAGLYGSLALLKD